MDESFFTMGSNNSKLASQANEESFELKTKPLSKKKIQSIAKQLQSKKAKTSFTTGRIDIVEPVAIIDDVAEVQIILEPLIQNGRELHTEIISKITSSEDWLLLTATEKNAILYMTNDQLGELALIYSTVNLAEWQTEPAQEELRIDLGTVRSCLSGALGLGDLYYLVVENPKALLSARGAIKILKHVGLRYLGVIGLGLAVWDFVDCIS